MCNATYNWGAKEPLHCNLNEHSTTLLNDIIHVGSLGGKEFYWNDRNPYGTPDPNAAIREMFKPHSERNASAGENNANN